ncbi:C40 family peptidase [Desulfoprunum benzoelyticum]|uniref:Cell wall-associated NlpC family hydrolase n=1 Tax=Desulfoprunum benzoelyticum TaxID=1506996 RepID=A0A840V6H2_9BACT|nr:NlpC/P60 family protein [Desulfoprunum benzoelyticum]MBB5349359.1 cell wall-associated NlpC family hydrolase [Desulfoprunum benzoelyticum]MBM9531066.1 C40 family peptidase [Desulfoprunum benzoelyticum]
MIRNKTLSPTAPLPGVAASSPFTTMSRILLPLLLALLLVSCGHKEVVYREASLADSARVKQALRAHYQKWRGTPYRPGGMSPAGVDCSGFIQLTYSQLFGLNPGRSTKDQLNHGRSVRRGDLRPGDLLFFRTGLFDRHVGIYFDDGLFVHASATKGVTVSNLKLAYWDRTFSTARRF